MSIQQKFLLDVLLVFEYAVKTLLAAWFFPCTANAHSVYVAACRIARQRRDENFMLFDEGGYVFAHAREKPAEKHSRITICTSLTDVLPVFCR
jgi:hypothetical protein